MSPCSGSCVSHNKIFSDDSYQSTSTTNLQNLLKGTDVPCFKNLISYESSMAAHLNRFNEDITICVAKLHNFLDETRVHVASQVYGARPIRRWLERKVVSEMSKMLIREEIDENTTVYIDAGMEALTYRVDRNGVKNINFGSDISLFYVLLNCRGCKIFISPLCLHLGSLTEQLSLRYVRGRNMEKHEKQKADERYMKRQEQRENRSYTPSLIS
ncbi:hypothetical protein RND81_12G061500 [Saponaria officinalis]|uniref:Clp ATPase C-terminal domain-containing protein n=1 Tax=Saponaria officinalis TaxID=3572 RepID=A0AAW1H3S1_SAPOF